MVSSREIRSVCNMERIRLPFLLTSLSTLQDLCPAGPDVIVQDRPEGRLIVPDVLVRLPVDVRPGTGAGGRLHVPGHAAASGLCAIAVFFLRSKNSLTAVLTTSLLLGNSPASTRVSIASQ